MRFYVSLFIIILSVSLYCQPHPVLIEVVNEDGGYPDTLLFEAWRTVNPGQVLNNESPDCFYPTGTITQYLQIQCGAFSSWIAGDTLHVEVLDPDTGEEGNGDYVLTFDNFQIFPLGAGGIVLSLFPPLIFTLPDSFHINEDEILTEDFTPYIVSLYGDEITLGFTGNTEIVIEQAGLDITFSAPADWFGYETISFNITDEHNNQVNCESNIIFDPINDIPLAVAGADQIAGDQNTVTLDASASSDIEDDDLVYFWTPPAGINLSDPAALNPVFQAPETVEFLELIFTLQVTDSQGAVSDPDETVITVFNDEPAGLEIILLPDSQVEFSWQQPAFPGNNRTRELLGYNVYLDLEWIDVTEETEYVLSNVYGEHTASVMAVFEEGSSDIVTIDFNYTGAVPQNILPRVTDISSIYPNPFNPSTILSYALAEKTQVKIDVYDIRGGKVTQLLDEIAQPGWYELTWNASSQSSGVYFIRMQAGKLNRYVKVNLIK
ncbi:MAG: T9SS type A sorting domain-containing protein [Candidatus Cloacimonetes bacterium]|nr:T9SS type A sorting domain-containing protein [Candidatus Cloacimonadota bacterium]